MHDKDVWPYSIPKTLDIHEMSFAAAWSELLLLASAESVPNAQGTGLQRLLTAQPVQAWDRVR